MSSCKILSLRPGLLCYCILALVSLGGRSSSTPAYAADVGTGGSMRVPSTRHRIQRALSYQPAIPLHILEQSNLLRTDNSRLFDVVARLLRGFRTKIAVVGGSISTYRGPLKDKQLAWPKQLHKWLQHVADDCMQFQNSSFVPHLEVLQTYAKTSTICNRTQVALFDVSTPAIVPQFAELCMYPRVPSDANIVIFEMCVNDCVDADKMDTLDRRAMESMLRQALGMGTRPAVIILCALKPQPSGFIPSNPYFGGVEEKHQLLAQYYGKVHFISARSMLLAFKQAGPADPQLMLPELFEDRVGHLTPVGHRLYADMLISLLQGAMVTHLSNHHAASSQQGPLEASTAPHQHQQHQQQHQQQQQQQQGSPTSSSTFACNSSKALHALVSKAGLLDPTQASRSLPPPLLGNVTTAGLCRINAQLRQTLVSARGFNWTDEGKHGTHKWGFVALQPDSTLELRVSTSLGPQHAGKAARVSVVHLRSYERMGQARVECSHGCRCAPAVIDGLWPAGEEFEENRQFNVWLLQVHELPDVSQHTQCTLRFTVLPDTRSGQHKFNVAGLVVSSQAFRPTTQEAIGYAVEADQTQLPPG